MVITVMKVFYKKQKPKIIQYRSYKSFDDHVFQTEFNKILHIDLNNADLPAFTEIFQSILDKHAPNPPSPPLPPKKSLDKQITLISSLKT